MFSKSGPPLDASGRVFGLKARKTLFLFSVSAQFVMHSSIVPTSIVLEPLLQHTHFSKELYHMVELLHIKNSKEFIVNMVSAQVHKRLTLNHGDGPGLIRPVVIARSQSSM